MTSQTASKRAVPLRPLIVLLALAGLVIAWLTLPLGEWIPVRAWIESALQWIDGIGPAAPAVFVALYAVATVLMLPGFILTVGAGAVFGWLLGTIAVSIGSTLGVSLAFVLGRTVARGWIERRIASRPVFRAIDQSVADNGFKIVLLTRLSPIFPFNLLNYALGVTRVRFRDYFFASWIGMLPATALYVYVGSLASDLAGLTATQETSGSSAAQKALLVVGLLATLAVVFLITRIARRALQEAIANVENTDAATGEATEK